MSFSRLRYDPCDVKKTTEESVSILSYLLDPNKYYSCSPCRIELGLVAGNNVSLYDGNMVDLESDLTNRTRANTRCPSGKFLPGTIIQGRDVLPCNPMQCGREGIPCGSTQCKGSRLVHLPSCRMFQYQPRPLTVGYRVQPDTCAGRGASPMGAPCRPFGRLPMRPVKPYSYEALPCHPRPRNNIPPAGQFYANPVRDF
jgi:hypothetical protein